MKSEYWLYLFEEGQLALAYPVVVGKNSRAYEPWFLSLITPWDGTGIQGTHDPSSIRKSVSRAVYRCIMKIWKS